MDSPAGLVDSPAGLVDSPEDFVFAQAVMVNPVVTSIKVTTAKLNQIGFLSFLFSPDISHL